MKPCEGCTFVNPWNPQYDRRNHKWMKSLCYCCDNSVNGKPRTMSEPVSLELFNSLEEKVQSFYVKYITNSNLVSNSNYIDNVTINKQYRGKTIL